VPNYHDRDGNKISAIKAAAFQARHPKEFREANPYANFKPDVTVETLHPKAQEALRQNLADGEEVLAVVHGARKSAMIATDRRVFIFKTGLASGSTFGSKFASFDYRNISSVQLHTGAMTGSAVLDVAGAAPVGSSYWGSKNNDPWKAQNALPIVRPWDGPKAQIARLRELIADWHERANPRTQAAPNTAGDNVIDQIKQLGELRDQGILTPDEFDTKKAELLDRL
jgi:hypothetical protein